MDESKKIRLTAAARAAFVELGREGGKIGGKIAAEVMTPEQKRARALKANAASQEAKRRKREAMKGEE